MREDRMPISCNNIAHSRQVFFKTVLAFAFDVPEVCFLSGGTFLSPTALTEPILPVNSGCALLVMWHLRQLKMSPGTPAMSRPTRTLPGWALMMKELTNSFPVCCGSAMWERRSRGDLIVTCPLSQCASKVVKRAQTQPVETWWQTRQSHTTPKAMPARTAIKRGAVPCSLSCKDTSTPRKEELPSAVV